MKGPLGLAGTLSTPCAQQSSSVCVTQGGPVGTRTCMRQLATGTKSSTGRTSSISSAIGNGCVARVRARDVTRRTQHVRHIAGSFVCFVATRGFELTRSLSRRGKVASQCPSRMASGRPPSPSRAKQMESRRHVGSGHAVCNIGTRYAASATICGNCVQKARFRRGPHPPPPSRRSEEGRTVRSRLPLHLGDRDCRGGGSVIRSRVGARWAGVRMRSFQRTSIRGIYCTGEGSRPGPGHFDGSSGRGQKYLVVTSRYYGPGGPRQAHRRQC